MSKKKKSKSKVKEKKVVKHSNMMFDKPNLYQKVVNHLLGCDDDDEDYFISMFPGKGIK